MHFHWLAALILLPLPLLAAETPDPAALEFFEKEVRPLLAGQCFMCHGPKKQSSGLRLDSREAILRGGDRGAAIVPGQPEKSFLISAVRRADDLEMPPETKLSEKQVSALTQWVRLGAAWPNSPPADTAADARSKHWAFQPVQDPIVPATAGNPIDAFIQSRLEAAGLTASPPADPRTLIRRASFDLTGLPPTPEEVEAFQQSAIRNPQSAIEALIDRLLASPHYGEQWGRHWLDVARYSDTKGYVYAREERFWVHAWAYRDWVVRAFNEDLPYDQFLLQQIAADQVARRGSRVAGGDGLSDAGPAVPGHDARHHRRPHRRGDARHDGPDGGLRPLPRSQVRSDPDAGLLFALRRV